MKVDVSWKWFIAVVAVFAIVALVQMTTRPGSSRSASGSSISADEQSALVATIEQQLRERRYPNPWNGQPVPCSSHFSLGEVSVLDMALTGDTGKIQISVPATHTGDRPFNVPGVCFGLPPGGIWSPGQTATWQEEFRLERWDSGWRLAANQSHFGN